MRVSFIGGGSDYPQFFNKNLNGTVIGTSINKYVYVMISNQPHFENYRYRFTYRRTEQFNKISQVKHPVLRAVLNELSIKNPTNIAKIGRAHV